MLQRWCSKKSLVSFLRAGAKGAWSDTGLDERLDDPTEASLENFLVLFLKKGFKGRENSKHESAKFIKVNVHIQAKGSAGLLERKRASKQDGWVMNLFLFSLDAEPGKMWC